MKHTDSNIQTPIPAKNLCDGPRFLKAKRIAARLGVCAKTVSRWADAGFIHRYKVTARTVLYSEAEVTAFIESARVP
jgi:hypothetical protein